MDRWNLFHMYSKMGCYRFRQRKTLWKKTYMDHIAVLRKMKQDQKREDKEK